LIIRFVKGPDKKELETGFMQLWGSASNGKETITKTLSTPEGYSFTVLASLFFVEALLAHKVMPGAFTPVQAIDVDHLLNLDAFMFYDNEEETFSEEFLSSELDDE
jgi:short subunit dehydrogenase-like uncharacterized protein